MNDEDTAECNIISIASHRDFSPKAEGSEILARAKVPCHHRRRVLHESERAVRCADCSARLDPWDILWANAKDYERRLDDWKRLSSLTERARKDVRTLERLERNVRARLKRLMGDGAPVKSSMVAPPPSQFTVATDAGEVVIALGEEAERLSYSQAVELAGRIRARAEEIKRREIARQLKENE